MFSQVGNWDRSFVQLGDAGKGSSATWQVVLLHSSGSAGVWRAETCSDVSEEADGKGKEEHRSDQDQEMHTLDAFIHKA